MKRENHALRDISVLRGQNDQFHKLTQMKSPEFTDKHLGSVKNQIPSCKELFRSSSDQSLIKFSSNFSSSIQTPIKAI